jgi:hypothetical protein
VKLANQPRTTGAGSVKNVAVALDDDDDDDDAQAAPREPTWAWAWASENKLRAYNRATTIAPSSRSTTEFFGKSYGRYISAKMKNAFLKPASGSCMYQRPCVKTGTGI